MIPSLPILSIVLRAYGKVFGNMGALLRAWLIPMLLMIVIDALRRDATYGLLTDFAYSLLEMPVYALAAIACHRIVLLGSDSLTNPWSLHWSRRESMFFYWLFMFAIMLYVAAMLLGVAVLAAPDRAFGYDADWLGGAIMIVVLFYLYGRFAMVFPATALDTRMIMSQSWLLTAGNGLRLTITLLLPIAPVYLAARLLEWSLPADVMQYAEVIYFPLELIGGAAVIATLSLSYQFLRDEVGDN
ncbi:MAG: hypothetical protein K0U72_08360 [Gammaproteobacteria bacterium]|nr:hypothetical protein [Gammaproteobacteria bacterium]